jgi:hypothetical protein
LVDGSYGLRLRLDDRRWRLRFWLCRLHRRFGSWLVDGSHGLRLRLDDRRWRLRFWLCRLHRRFGSWLVDGSYGLSPLRVGLGRRLYGLCRYGAGGLVWGGGGGSFYDCLSLNGCGCGLLDRFLAAG